MSASTVFKMNTGDLLPPLQAALLNPDNSPVILTNASVLFVMSQKGVTLLSAVATVINEASGVVQYNWQPGDTYRYGSCKGVFVVTFSSGLTQSFPVGADLNIVFPQNLQQFTTLDEAVSHLNMSGPDSNGNFTVYGLPVSAASVQAQVDHANKYVASLVPSLQEGTIDPRLASAELAATDLACMGVLVASVGGALVGAYDYFLGDMRVARSGPYASAIEKAIAGYSQSARQELQNVTLPVASAKAKLGDRVLQKGCLGSQGWPLS